MADPFVVNDHVVTTQRDVHVDWLPLRKGCRWSSSGSITEVCRGPGARVAYEVRHNDSSQAYYAASELQLSTDVWARMLEYGIDPSRIVLHSRSEGQP